MPDCPDPRCNRKTLHASRADAVRALAAQARHRGFRGGGKPKHHTHKVQVYRCPGDHGFHVGHGNGAAHR